MVRRTRRKKATVVKARKRAFNLTYNKDKWVRGPQQIKLFRDKLKETSTDPSGLPYGDSGMSQICLDHDHSSGICRGTLRSDTNLYLGRLELYHRKLFGKTDVKLIDILREIVYYLEQSENIEKILHWEIVEAEKRKVSRYKIETLRKKLDIPEEVEYSKHEIVELWLQRFIDEKERTL